MKGARGGNGSKPPQWPARPCEDSREPLRESVRSSVRRYFEALDGHDCGGLYDLVLSEVEAPMLETVLEHTRGNQTRAARLLGINRGTLRKKLELYGLD